MSTARWQRRTLRHWLAKKLKRSPDEIEMLFCRYKESCPFKIEKPMTHNVMRAWRLCGSGETCNQRTYLRQTVDISHRWR